MFPFALQGAKHEGFPTPLPSMEGYIGDQCLGRFLGPALL